MPLKSGLVKGEKLVSSSGCVIGEAQRWAGGCAREARGCGKDAAGVTRVLEMRSARGQKERAAKKSLAKTLRLFGNEGGLNSAADKRGWVAGVGAHVWAGRGLGPPIGLSEQER